MSYYKKIKLNAIIEYGLYLLVFLLPWQARIILKAGDLNGGYFEYGSISLYATDLLLLALLSLFLILHVKNKKITNYELRITNFFWLICGLELIVFVSIFFADDKLIAVYKYTWFLLGVGFLRMLLKADYRKIKLIASFLAGVFSQAVLGSWQFLNQFASAFKWSGMAEHDPSVLGVSVVEAVGQDGIGERWLRAYGSLDHPNILGGLLAIGILLTILFIIRNNKTEDHEPQSANYKYVFPALYLLLLASLSALFFSFSRSAWLACGAGIIVMLVVGMIKKDWFFQREMLKIILSASILIFILFINFSNLAVTRVKAQSRLEQKSNIERIESYKNSFAIIKNNFLFGVGMGNYTLALAKTHPDQPAYVYQPVHNVFLLVMAELGIFGLLIFAGLLIYIFYLLIKNKNSYKLGLLFALFILLFLDHYFWGLHFGILLLFFVFAFLLNEHDSRIMR